MTVPLNNSYFGKRYQKSFKIAEYLLHQLICLGLLEIHIAHLKSQPINVRILSQGYCVSIVSVLTRDENKNSLTPSKSSKKLNELSDFSFFANS